MLRGPKRATIASFTALGFAVSAGADDATSDRDAILQGKKLYSQNNEELVIRHFFADRRDGFFVDVGSWHWRDASTTYYLEHHLGWSGIAIDAQSKLGDDYRKHRPRTNFVSYIVTNESGTTQELFLGGPVSSTNEKRVDAYYPKHAKPASVEVPTITLDDLLEQNDVERIDFLSMDIEGGEMAALAGFDIARYRPALVCIEAGRQGRKKQATEWFEGHGYERVDEYLRHDAVNLYFRPKADAQ